MSASNLPKNLKNGPCTAQSSDCVVWDGPEIPCIALCPGDTITKAVYILALRVCALEAQLDISNYDIQCISTVGTPKNFQEMISFLITKVCNP